MAQVTQMKRRNGTVWWKVKIHLRAIRMQRTFRDEAEARAWAVEMDAKYMGKPGRRKGYTYGKEDGTYNKDQLREQRLTCAALEKWPDWNPTMKEWERYLLTGRRFE